jgi:hypothetical protein
MKEAVQQIVAEASERAVDMAVLPATLAIEADQHCPAIGAGAVTGLALRAMMRRDDGSSQCASRRTSIISNPDVMPAFPRSVPPKAKPNSGDTLGPLRHARAGENVYEARNREDMSGIKTKANERTVADFMATVSHPCAARMQ